MKLFCDLPSPSNTYASCRPSSIWIVLTTSHLTAVSELSRGTVWVWSLATGHEIGRHNFPFFQDEDCFVQNLPVTAVRNRKPKLMIMPKRCERPWEKTAGVSATANVTMMSSHLCNGFVTIFPWLTLNCTFFSLKNILHSFRQASLWRLRQSAPSNRSAPAQCEMGDPFTTCIPNMEWPHGLPREYSLSTSNDGKFQSSRGVLANDLSILSMLFYFELSPLLCHISYMTSPQARPLGVEDKKPRVVDPVGKVCTTWSRSPSATSTSSQSPPP